MGYDSEGAIKDGSNGAGPVINVQDGGTVSDIIWQPDLGDDRVYSQGLDGVLPSECAEDQGEDGKVRGRRRVEVTTGRGGDGS